jgi:hypothetical protein
MNHVFMVRMSRASSSRDTTYEVVAPNATSAISKAKRQARREYTWRGTWTVEELLHRGFAV